MPTIVPTDLFVVCHIAKDEFEDCYWHERDGWVEFIQDATFYHISQKAEFENMYKIDQTEHEQEFLSIYLEDPNIKVDES